MTRVSKPHRKLMFHTSYKWQASVFAAIKGQTVPKYADWLIRSHPVAINGLWMHVQSGYHSQDGLLFCVQFRRRRIRLWYQRATERAAQIGFWLCTGRSVVGDDWPLCVWSVVIAGVSVIVPACTMVGRSARLFDVIRKADSLTMTTRWSAQLAPLVSDAENTGLLTERLAVNSRTSASVLHHRTETVSMIHTYTLIHRVSEKRGNFGWSQTSIEYPYRNVS